MPIKLVKGRHGSPHYYLRGTVRGVRVDESTGTHRRGQAEEIRARREAELLEASINGRRAVVTFSSAVASYVTEGGDARYLGPLEAFFGQRRLVEINQAEIDRCAATLKPKAAKSTINRQIHTPLSAVMKHAAARGWCEFKPIIRPRQPKGRTRWLSVDEANRLIAACAPHLRPIVVFMLYTGARVSEAVYLDWRHVNLGRAHVTFVDTKNGEDRGVPLHQAVLADLANLPHRDGEVFRKPDGHPYPVLEDGGGPIKTAFKAACRRARLADVSPHTLRHTWASWYYEEHRDLTRLMELGGWKSLAMVARYAHVNSSHHAASIAGLPNLKTNGETNDEALQRGLAHNSRLRKI